MPLILDANGNKFGKSEGNALWLDKNKTSSYELYQYLINTDDRKVEEYLKVFTFLSKDEIIDIVDKHNAAPELRIAQKKLAEEMITDLRGKEEYIKAKEISESLFSDKIYNLSKEEILDALNGVTTFDLNLGESIGIADIPLDFYIEVVGENTKVYGMFRNIPHIIVVSYDSFTTVSSEFLFEPAKHYDASSDDSIGGYFHIIRNEYHRITEQFEQYYYRCTSQGFLDDIVNYLLVSVINFRFTIVETIGNIDLSTTKGTVSYEDMFMTNGFGYSENNGVSKWDVGLNLNNVTGIDALRTLDAHLYGEEDDANGVSKYYFNKLEGLLTVKASIITITLNATINLEDIDPSKHSWAEQFPDINARFEKVCKIYNGKTTSEKESYDQTYLNKSDKGCRIYLDSSMPSILA